MNLFPKTVMFTVPSEDPIIGTIVDEDDKFLYVDYPLILIKDNMQLFMTPYLNFASNGKVMYNKSNIVGYADLDSNMITYYEQMVKLYREKDQNTKIRVYDDKVDGPSEQTTNIPKTFH